MDKNYVSFLGNENNLGILLRVKRVEFLQVKTENIIEQFIILVMKQYFIIQKKSH